MANAREPVDGRPSPWTCLSWRRRPSSRKVKAVLGWAIGAAVAFVLLSVWAAQPRMGCSTDPNVEITLGTKACVTAKPQRVGWEVPIPARPYLVTWAIVIGLAVVAVAIVYLWWPRRATPLAWMEFERRSSSLRAPLAEHVTRTNDPAAGRQLEEFDADYAEIQHKYAPRSRRPFG
ncbi:hypothetical protein ACWDTI_17680 [Gordonia sp. NPDC003424]